MPTPYRRGYAAEERVLRALRRCGNVVFASRLPASRPLDIIAVLECGGSPLVVLLEVKSGARCQPVLRRLRERLRTAAAQLGRRAGVVRLAGAACVKGQGCAIIDAESLEAIDCQWDWERLPTLRDACDCEVYQPWAALQRYRVQHHQPPPQPAPSPAQPQHTSDRERLRAATDDENLRETTRNREKRQ